MSKPQTPTELQDIAYEYLNTLSVPAGSDPAQDWEVWTVDADSGSLCSNNCHRVGIVLIDDFCYCVPHASAHMLNNRERGHMVVDVARPILVPDELSAAEDLLVLMRNFGYLVANHKGSTITVAMAQRAEALAARCNKALRARMAQVEPVTPE